jgi:PKD repeat protein
MKHFLQFGYAIALTAAAQSQILPPTVSNDAANFAKAAAYSARCDGVSMIVMLNGATVFEDFQANYVAASTSSSAWHIWSGAKTFWGPVAALAVHEGLISSLDEKASDTITEWQSDPLKKDITIRQLLGLVAGLQVNYLGDPPEAGIGPVPGFKAIGAAAVAAPGSIFAYSETPFQCFGEVLRRKLAAQSLPSDPVSDYLIPKILTPIGSAPSTWPTSGYGQKWIPSGCFFTARNWAKYGELIRLGGNWGGTQIIPQALLDQCFVAGTPNPAYGMSWWVDATTATPISGDMVKALGAGGQNLFISRSRQLTVVRQCGSNPFDTVSYARQAKFREMEFFKLLSAGVNHTTDTDGDFIPDADDAFPANANDWVDGDADGMGDDFEWRIIRANTGDAITTLAHVLPGDNFDGDARTNLQEFQDGTDPTVVSAVALVLNTSVLTVSEGGTAAFTVRLASAPAASVTVNVLRTSGDADLSVSSGAALTFTTANWNTPQSVTLAAAQDVDTTPGSAVFTLSGSGIASTTLNATENDNDIPSQVLPQVVLNSPLNFAKAALYSAKCDGVSFILMLDGQIVHEEYPTTYASTAGPNTAWELFSAGKSFWGPVAALAVHEGLLSSLDEKVADTITDWQGVTWKQDITIRQLLQLISGIEPNFTGSPSGPSPTRPGYIAIQTPAKYAPGTFFEYGQTPTQVFGEVLRRKLAAQSLPSDPVTDYLIPKILTPIGGEPASWNVLSNGERQLPSGGFFTARNWVKYAELMRLGGNWNGTQIIPQALLDQCLTGSATQPLYGVSWWLDAVTGTSLSGDMFKALGTGGQNLFVSRSRTLTVLRQATPNATDAVTRARQTMFNESEFFKLLGWGVNATTDSDGDLIPDSKDAFPSNPNDWVDGDLDGMGDDFEWRIVKANPGDAITTITQVNGSDDFDSDGKTNLTEFLEGGDPTAATPALIASASAVTVPEGGTQTFTVRLSVAPTATTTVNVARTSGDADLSVSSGAALSFTTSNWATPQTVTLAAAQDADSANGSAVFTVSSSGLSSLNVTATEADNDSPLVVNASANFTNGFAPLPVQFNVTVSGGTPWPADTIWFDDALPPGAVLASSGGDTWTGAWVSSDPSPKSGTLSHRSQNIAGDHRRWFTGATTGMPVTAGESLVCWVYLDPVNPPRTLMLRWNDGDWLQGAYWGENLIAFGQDKTASRRYIGPLPPTGQWVRLAVPASQVDLVGRTVTGMAFFLFDGRVTFDAAGKGASPDGLGGYSYAWSFGDGSSSTAQNPAKTFANANVHAVTVTVTDSNGATGQQTLPITVRPIPTAGTPGSAWLTHGKNYTPGTYDENNVFMGGTEAMWVLGHKGKLFASIGYAVDVPGTDPSPGAQMLRKDTANGPWVVDVNFGTNYLRAEGLISAVFTNDLNGTPLSPPANLLIAGPSDLASPQITAFSRDDTTGTWTRMDFATAYGGIRSFHVHRDSVTGVDCLFAGLNNGAVFRGRYDASLPGKIRWDSTPEMTGTGLVVDRIMAFTTCNGVCYAARKINGAAQPVTGGLYRRNDATRTWSLVYRWPTTTLAQTEFLRGLTTVPDPLGGGHEIILGAFEVPGTIVRFDPTVSDPVNGIGVTTELDIRAYFNAVMPGQIINQTGAAAAYNRFTPFTDPDTGERVWLCGTWVSLQNNTTPPNNGTFYLIRHRDGSYHHGYINDPLHPVPSGQQLTGCRDIEPSPFPEDAGRVLYLCGYDGGIGPSHNSAWIYRSTIPPAPKMSMQIIPLGGTNYRLDLDAPAAAHYQFEQSDDLQIWTPASAVQFLPDGLGEMNLTLPGGTTRKFYRAKFATP